MASLSPTEVVLTTVFYVESCENLLFAASLSLEAKSFVKPHDECILAWHANLSAPIML